MGTLSAQKNIRSMRERISVWAEQHWQAAKGAAQSMRRSALATPLTVAVIGIALVLPESFDATIDAATGDGAIRDEAALGLVPPGERRGRGVLRPGVSSP